MKKIFYLLLFACFTKSYFQEQSHSLFLYNKPNFSKELIYTDPLILEKACKSMLNYIETQNKNYLKKKFNEKIVDIKKTKDTLKFIINLVEKDKKNNKFRILDPKYLNQNFNFVKWSGDSNSALKNNINLCNNNIRLTKYAIFKTKASYKKDYKNNCAIYQIIDKNLTQNSINYSKQEIINGALDNLVKLNKIKTLAWVSRDSLEDALMQGTIITEMPDKKIQFLNVDKCNNFTYNKKIKVPYDQKRYWFFKEINNANYNKNSGIKLNPGNLIFPQVIFAGDVYNLGIGKIVAIKYQNPLNNKLEIRLGVLADTGGALNNNLYQLDYFMGIFESKEKFNAKIKNIPNSVQAYFLVKK